MGLREVASIDVGSMVVEAGTWSISDSVTDQAKKKAPENAVRSISFDDIDRYHMSYSPWDDDVLYYRLTKSKVTKECNMVEFLECISSKLEKLPTSDERFRHFQRQPHMPYEVQQYKPSCPSLTDGSTASSRSSASDEFIRPFGQVSRVPIRARLKQAKGFPDNLDNVDFPPLFADSAYLATHRLSNGKIDQNEDIRSHVLNRFELGEVDGSSPKEADTQMQARELGDSDLLGPESPSDTSSEDDDEDERDPFEALHQAIRHVFSSNMQLADKIINYLYQLPPERRTQVYGYRGNLSYSNTDSRNSSNSVSYGNSPGARKRKRVNAASRSDSPQSQVHEDGNQENQVLVERSSAAPSPPKRFACGYNVFDRARYGPRNIRSATQYKSCAGPGFKSLNHYKRHLERVHTLYQCPRCGESFEASGEVEAHLAQDQRCSAIPFEREGMSQEKWDEVKSIFKRGRRGQSGPTDEERWFLAWEALFPGNPRPPSAYYEEQDAQIPYPIVFIRTEEIYRASLSDMPQIDPTLREELMRRLGDAFNAASRSIPSDLETIDPSAPIAPVQVPIFSNGSQNDTIGISQTSHIDPSLPDPDAVEQTVWGAMDSVGEPNGIEPFEDLLGLDFFEAAIVGADGQDSYP
ncbi:hypothetical protein F5Y05DRAFT_416019 [Hypoxylon sp. FL0543]|nr:hypothetical protein F5Y05DRAFT_416019 [Hypoxylon sp. FL0543]